MKGSGMAKRKPKYDIGKMLSGARINKQAALKKRPDTVYTGNREDALRHYCKIIWLCGQVKKLQRQLKQK
jgi:hypothetical protein